MRGYTTSGNIRIIARILRDEFTQRILRSLLEHPEGVKVSWVTTLCFYNKLNLHNPKERRKAYQRTYRRIKTLAKHGLVVIESPKNFKFKIIKLNPARALHVINLIFFVVILDGAH